ncbi:hypothetical protein POTOM_047091 [Populus tomentosa]|uniref:Uncharacterized protein n=1 Tax=Populus tomentosa TaxID=118781 RepID=A0A8X7YC27_POPTO|nr:hypothetical protein POTOM_047091 [Populus tomentosa]
MSKTLFPDGLSFVTFSDGTMGSSLKMTECITSEVARAQHLPAAFLWIQPATVFDIYFYYFNGYGDIFSNCKDTSNVIALPGLPQFASRDLPSFLLPSNTSTVALQLFQEQLEQLSQETNPKLLVNSFDALELGAMNATEKFNLIGIGPLIPSAFLDGKDPLDKSFGGDLFQGSEDYTEWLNSKPKSSVVYVSFGSILVLSNRQMEEISRGLVQSGLPFLLLWMRLARAASSSPKPFRSTICHICLVVMMDG